MAWNEGLSDKALAIASAKDRRLRVMAGPGTGKSWAMKRRVARLIEDEGCDPARILAVTLTRNAAKELTSDLRNLGVSGCEKVQVGTLHGYCLRLVQGTGALHYLGRTPRLLMQFEDKPLIEDLRKQGVSRGKREAAERIKAFEASWARLQSDTPGWPTDPADRRFHDAMLDWLKFHEALRVGELVPLALQYLRNNPASEELRAFDHVVVDEYQDLNKAEQEIVRLLAENGHLAVVGDEDQSIYGFRHAHPGGIREFNQVHPGTKDEELTECRRCPTKVVELANNLIKLNHPPGSGERLAPCADNKEGEVRIVQWSSLQSEIHGIVEYVKLQKQGGRPAKDFMVLCQSKDIGREIRNELRKAGVDAHSFYSEDALEYAEAQEGFELLALLVNPEDRTALRFLLGFGSPTLLAGEYAKLRILCTQTGKHPRVLLDEFKTAAAPAGMRRLLARYLEVDERIRTIGSLTGEELVENIFPEVEEWAKPVREIVDRILDSQVTPQDIYEELVTALTQPEMPAEGEFVRIMSLHKSKGLSSPIVIVASCVQGIIPRIIGKLSPEEKQRRLEEQRRLFYVAMTRSREVLVISSAISWPREKAYGLNLELVRGGRGNREMGEVMASSFIQELGPGAPSPVAGDRFLAEVKADQSS